MLRGGIMNRQHLHDSKELSLAVTGGAVADQPAVPLNFSCWQVRYMQRVAQGS